MSIGADHCVWTGAHDFCVVGVGRGPGDAGGDAPESRGAPEGAARLGSRARQRGRATDRRPACRVPACRVPFRHDREDARARRRPHTGFSVRVRCIASRRGHSAATQVTTSTGPDLRPDTRIRINTQVRTVARADMSTPHRPASQARAPRLTALSRTSTVEPTYTMQRGWSGIGMVLAWYEPHSLCIAISLIGIAARCRVCSNVCTLDSL